MDHADESEILIMTENNDKVIQTPTVANLVHYRNIFASPENFIKRKVDYSKMKVSDEKYRKELERYNSFEGVKHIFNEDQLRNLSKSGFYYKENSMIPDQVKCVYCQGNISGLKKNDVPMKLHKFNFPTCPFIIYLNVGNECLSLEDGKLPIYDPDVKRPEDSVEVIIPKVNSKNLIEIFDQIDNLDIEFREQTFMEYPTLKHMAFRGLFLANKISSKFVKCSWCMNEVIILKGIECLEDDLIHRSYCKFKNIEDILNKKVEKSQKSVENFCDIEFSLTTDEIDARMEMKSISMKTNELKNKKIKYELTDEAIKILTDYLNKSEELTKEKKLLYQAYQIMQEFRVPSTIKLLKAGFDQQKLRIVVENQLKRKGKDFDSLLDLIIEYKKDNKYDTGILINENQEFALCDYQCVVCLDKSVEVVFLPCGHLKTCLNCSNLMLSCPVCRVRIVKRVKKFKFNGDILRK